MYEDFVSIPGYPDGEEEETREDEMIANIEGFIKEYVEEALHADYFRKFAITNAQNAEQPPDDCKIFE